MIIKDRFVFVHVPKTGGVSVTEALGGRTKGMALHLPLARIKAGNRFTFGFMRNPWARLVSLHRFLMADGRATVPFRPWLTDGAFNLDEDRDGDPPLQRRPQMWWLDGCDFIGRFERLQEDFDLVSTHIGIAPRRLPHLNATAGGDWRGEYDDGTWGFVERHFARDIERFGY